MKVGIVGAGNIVRCCLEALEQIDGISCIALCVRHVEKAHTLQQEFGITTIYTDYEQFLSDPEIDFVYLGIPNKLHFAYALQALEHDKHVIVEKPFTSNADEANQLVTLTQSKQRFLFEAITTLYAPNVLLLKENLSRLGDIKLVQSNYSQLSSRYSQYLMGNIHPAFDPKMSGGSLYDINIYNIHLSCFLFGMPNSIEYIANKGFNGIDTSGVAILKYDDFISVCTGAKDSASPSQTIIQGTQGYLRLTSSPNIAHGAEFNINGKTEQFNQNEYENHMVYEMKAFQKMFQSNDIQTCYQHLEHSLNIMNLLTLAREKAGIHFS